MHGAALADRLNGAAGADDLRGAGGNDVLRGAVGDDYLVGGAGADRLIGGVGHDKFVFDARLGASNVDTVVDFAAGDRLLLDAAIFAPAGAQDGSGALIGNGAGAAIGAQPLAARAFALGAAAHNAYEHILYDRATGDLRFDADGAGGHAAVLFAVVDGHAALTAADFLVL